MYCLMDEYDLTPFYLDHRAAGGQDQAYVRCEERARHHLCQGPHHQTVLPAPQRRGRHQSIQRTRQVNNIHRDRSILY